jgi:hypothetical protein
VPQYREPADAIDLAIGDNWIAMRLDLPADILRD